MRGHGEQLSLRLPGFEDPLPRFLILAVLWVGLDRLVRHLVGGAGFVDSGPALFGLGFGVFFVSTFWVHTSNNYLKFYFQF